MGSSRSPAPISRIALPMVALAAYTAHNLPDGMEPGLKETAFYDPTNFTFPAGAYICELEVDPGNRQDVVRQLRGGGRFRPADQSDDRRRPGPWRACARHRPGAAGRCRLRQQRPACDGVVHGLRHAARRRSAIVPVEPHHDALSGQPARRQGLWRGRRDRRVGLP